MEDKGRGAGRVGMERRRMRVGMEGRRKARVTEGQDGQRTLFCSQG